jgi:hypothetical protein
MVTEKKSKKEKSQPPGNWTYKLKRECLYCGESLPDQYSKKRTYCKEERDENGKLVKDCKGNYNRFINKPENEVHREIIKDHKTVDERIESMVSKKGNIVSTADLNAYDIQLASSLKYKISKNGTLESDFLKYKIVSNPNLHTHKIYNHGQF